MWVNNIKNVVWSKIIVLFISVQDFWKLVPASNYSVWHQVMSAFYLHRDPWQSPVCGKNCKNGQLMLRLASVRNSNLVYLAYQLYCTVCIYFIIFYYIFCIFCTLFVLVPNLISPTGNWQSYILSYLKHQCWQARISKFSQCHKLATTWAGQMNPTTAVLQRKVGETEWSI